MILGIWKLFPLAFWCCTSKEKNQGIFEVEFCPFLISNTIRGWSQVWPVLDFLDTTIHRIRAYPFIYRCHPVGLICILFWLLKNMPTNLVTLCFAFPYSKIWKSQFLFMLVFRRGWVEATIIFLLFLIECKFKEDGVWFCRVNAKSCKLEREIEAYAATKIGWGTTNKRVKVEPPTHGQRLQLDS